MGSVPIDTFFDALNDIVGRRLRLRDQALQATIQIRSKFYVVRGI